MLSINSYVYMEHFFLGHIRKIRGKFGKFSTWNNLNFFLNLKHLSDVLLYARVNLVYNGEKPVPGTQIQGGAKRISGLPCALYDHYRRSASFKELW